MRARAMALVVAAVSSGSKWHIFLYNGCNGGDGLRGENEEIFKLYNVELLPVHIVVNIGAIMSRSRPATAIMLAARGGGRPS